MRQLRAETQQFRPLKGKVKPGLQNIRQLSGCALIPVRFGNAVGL